METKKIHVQSTYMPETKMSFNDWATYIYTELKKQYNYDPRRENI